MKNDVKTLQNIGLTEKQAVVYSALLELGEANMTDLAGHAGLKRPTVYLIIDELELLGMVSQITKGKKKMYSAVHPKRIAEILDSRKKQFQEVLPELVAKYGSLQGKPKVQMLEGIEGVRKAYQIAFDLMKENKNEGLWIGNIGFLEENFPDMVKSYKDTIGSLKNYTIREINFGDEGSITYTKELKEKNKKYHQGIYINDEGSSGLTDQFIIGNKVIFFSIDKQLFTLIVEGEEIAKSQRFLFDTIWKAYI